jgi:predicted lipoprotein with Yx(FWY)xxD motif
LDRILVHGRGHTLYLFENDRRGSSACAGRCATYWPPLLTNGKSIAGNADGDGEELLEVCDAPKGALAPCRRARRASS